MPKWCVERTLLFFEANGGYLLVRQAHHERKIVSAYFLNHYQNALLLKLLAVAVAFAFAFALAQQIRGLRQTDWLTHATGHIFS